MTIDMKAIHDSDRTLVMGVLNITEDSFSDGGLWLDPAKAKGLTSSTSVPNPLAPEPNASVRKMSKPAC